MRVWVTEYGYQTNPPDPIFGVTWSKQAKYLTQAVAIARANPRIDMFLWFLLRDEQRLGGWQSGLTTFDDKRKPSFNAFRRAAVLGLTAPRHSGVAKGYAEGPAAEEAERRREELAAGESSAARPRRGSRSRAATPDDPERHFLGWADEVDADALFASGAAWGIRLVRRPP